MEQQHGTFGMTSARTLRLAKSSECGSLSALALRSKAYWGYDSAFLQACRDELTVSPKAAAARRAVVLIEQAPPLGDRKSAVWGQSVSVRVDHVGRRTNKKKKN